jgi:hypothetical protein
MDGKKWLSTSLVILSLIGCGGGDSDSGESPPANVAPTANAGPEQTVEELTIVTLSGSGTDSDGSIASYGWEQTAGTSVTLSNASSASATFTTPDINADETLVFKLTVTDDDGAENAGSVNINVISTQIIVTSQAMIGPLAGAKINAYLITDWDTPIEGPLTTTVEGSLNEVGSFSLSLTNIPDDDWVLVTASGGYNIDADADGKVDTSPTINQGTIHGFAQASHWRAGGNINMLTEIMWQQIKMKNTDHSIKFLANTLIANDITGDGKVDIADILSFKSYDASHKNALAISYEDLIAKNTQGKSVIDYFHEGNRAVAKQTIEQLFPIMTNQPEELNLLDANVLLTLPENRRNINADNVSVSSFISDTAQITDGDAPTLLIAEDDTGKTLLLGYAIPSSSGQNSPQAQKLTGHKQATSIMSVEQVEISPKSTALALVMMSIGDKNSNDAALDIASNILAHADFEPLVTSVSAAFSSDPYFLDSLMLNTNLVAQIKALSKNIHETGQGQANMAGLQRAKTYTSKRQVVSQQASSPSPTETGKVFDSRPWDTHQPWDWYGTATKWDVTDIPFISVQSEKPYNLMASANPSMTNYTMELYNNKGELLNWYLVPRNSTYIQKWSNEYAAYRSFNINNKITSDTAHIEFHKYIYDKSVTGRRAITSLLNTIHLGIAVYGVVADGKAINDGLHLVTTSQAAISVLASCAPALISTVDFQADGSGIDKIKTFFKNNGSSFFETTLTSCLAPAMSEVINAQVVANITGGMVTGLTKAAAKMSNPIGWAVIAFDASNELAPYTTSLFWFSNEYAGYDLVWGSHSQGGAMITDVIRTDKRPTNEGTSVTKPIATFNVSHGQGLAYNFDASDSVYDSNATPSFSWKFGDGFVAGGKTVPHTFVSTGKKTITLTIKDGLGNEVTSSYALNVTNGFAPSVDSLSCQVQPDGVSVEVTAAISDPDNDLSNLYWYLSPSDDSYTKATAASSLSQTLTYPSDGVTSFTPAVRAVDSAGNETIQSISCGGTSTQPPATGFGKLNDTGITTCADNSSNGLTCPASGFEGQDAEHGRDALAAAGKLQKIGAGNAGFDFTKLDDAGNPLSESATDWSCVRDNHTGLIWEVKTDDGGLRDKNNRYSWYNTDQNTNGGDAGKQNGGVCTGTSCDTAGYVEAVNAQGLCDAGDWRMPTPFELLGIVHNGQDRPSIDTDFFPNTITTDYWSSVPGSASLHTANLVDFSYAKLRSNFKMYGFRVRLVRVRQ